MAKKNYRIDPVPALVADAQKALDRLKAAKSTSRGFFCERGDALQELDRVVHRLSEVLHQTRHR